MHRAIILLLAANVWAADLPLYNRFAERLRGPNVRVRMVEGVETRVQNGKLYLRLRDFVALVLKNNTEIQLTNLDVLTADSAVTAAKAPFDPTFGAFFTSMRTQSPQTSQISGAETLNSLNQQAQAGFSQVLASGQKIELGFSSNRMSNNNRFSFLNPSIMTGLNFSVMQPLLLNRGNLQYRGPLKIARTQLLIASSESETKIADMIALAARQYWDAIQARDNIRVQQQSVDLAQKSYDRDRIALELDALPKLEIYQSQSQVAQRKLSLVQAQFAYNDVLDGLRRLIGADLNPATRNVEIVLEDDPSSLPIDGTAQPIEDSIAAALASRPELKSVQRRGDIDDLNARMARNSMLPRLDIGVQGGGSGLGGNQVPVSGPLGEGPSTFVPGGVGDALSQMFGFRAPYYGFSIQMTLPVRSSLAQANLANALVSRARNKYQERQLQQQIIQDVKRAANELEMARAQIEAAKVARDLTQKNVDAAQKKYELGTITAFETLDAQSRLVSVESVILGAYTSYQKALIAYKRATWTLFDEFGIRLANAPGANQPKP
jgi:outer membrane protein